MTSSPRPRRPRRRNSMEEPHNLSDVIYLKDKLNREYEEISPECRKHIDKMSAHVDEFEKDYRLATRLSTGGTVVGSTTAIAGMALYAFTAGLSVIIGTLIAAASIASAIIAAIGEFQKKYKKIDIRKNIETELEELQRKIRPIIDTILRLKILSEEILRDPTLSENKANAMRERFSYCFEKMQLFQGDDNREVGDRMSKTLHSSGNLLETFAEISSVLDVLEEILEDVEQESNDRPAETPRPKQIDEKEFKIKAEKFIIDMKKGIDQLKNVMNEISKTKERISRTEYSLTKHRLH